MNLAAEAPQWLALIVAVLLLAAAIEDAVRLRISNLIVLLVIVAAVVAVVIAGPELALWKNLVVFVGLLAIGTPMFAAGKLGGGDVKLLAAAGLWFDFAGALWMILAVALVLVAVVLTVVIMRYMSSPRGVDPQSAVSGVSQQPSSASQSSPATRD